MSLIGPRNKVPIKFVNEKLVNYELIDFTFKQPKMVWLVIKNKSLDQIELTSCKCVSIGRNRYSMYPSSDRGICPKKYLKYITSDEERQRCLTYYERDKKLRFIKSNIENGDVVYFYGDRKEKRFRSWEHRGWGARRKVDKTKLNVIGGWLPTRTDTIDVEMTYKSLMRKKKLKMLVEE